LREQFNSSGLSIERYFRDKLDEFIKTNFPGLEIDMTDDEFRALFSMFFTDPDALWANILKILENKGYQAKVAGRVSADNEISIEFPTCKLKKCY